MRISDWSSDVCSSDLLCWNKSSYQRKSDHFKVWPTNEGRDVMQSLVELGSMDAVCTRYPAWRWISEDEKKWEWIERPAMVQAYLFFRSEEHTSEIQSLMRIS